MARSQPGAHRAAAGAWWRARGGARCGLWRAVRCTLAVVVVWVGGGFSWGGAEARADMIYRLLPAVGIGVTDNAGTSSGDAKVADGFANASVAASARYARALSIHRLDASVLFTRYILGRGPSALTAVLAWASSFKLSSSLDLSVGATGTISRASPIAVVDVTTVAPTAYAATTSYYASAAVTQGLTYTPTPRQIYGESVAFSQARTLGSSATGGLPTTDAVTAKLTAGWLLARDGLFIEPMVTDAFTTGGDTAVPTAIPATGRVISADVAFRWQHEIGYTWSSQLAAGPLAIYETGRTTAYNYMALAAVTYHRLPWYASLSVAQTPIPNLYLGAVTLNDEALARAALPLTRDDLVFLAGFAGYTYARLSDADGNFHHAFDLRSAGASLSSQFRNRPFALSLVYTLTDQHGVITLPGISSLNIERQTLLLTLTGVFSWGPGTLPLFRGGIEQGGV